MNMLVAVSGWLVTDTVCAGGVNGWMDWQPEIVYAVLGAVVTGVLREPGGLPPSPSDSATQERYPPREWPHDLQVLPAYRGFHSIP